MATDLALEALRRALVLEKEGIKFYGDAAQKVQDVATRQMFATLANDEKQHQKMLMAQVRSLRENKGWRKYPAAEEAACLAGAPSLFPKDKAALDRISQTSTDIDALRFGLTIENRSFEFYFKAAHDSESSEGRSMYAFLAETERGHFDMLMMRLEGIIGPLGWTY
ncbi:MAG: ferritin family protein [Chloroflexi bacterium]|nr:ferritin family protein [Chloroflexota bacterium]